MLRMDIYKNWILQNENWERYLLCNTVLLHTCLHSLLLKLFSETYCMTNITNVYFVWI